MQHAPYAGAPPGALAIPLKARGGGVRSWAIVDEADYEWAVQYNWHERDGYARRNLPGRNSGTVMMHREVIGLAKGDPRIADHINRDRLDNRRENLRIVTRGQNGENQKCNARLNRSSKYRGVSFHKRIGKYMAYCRLDGKLHHLGYYATEEEAAKVASAFRAKHMPLSEDAA